MSMFFKDFQRRGIEEPELREKTIGEWTLNFN
jgi:hypothetical protein